MPFSPNKLVLPVLPKPENATGGCLTENIPLSAIEDKELRKKLRNRQSALAARERKKARMLELEKQVAELQDTNRRTEEENQYLRSRLEIALRKCVRVGIPLDNEHDLMWIRSSNISLLQSRAVSRSRVMRVVSSQPMKHPSLISPKDCPEKIPVATSHEIKARGQTEASLKSAIKALGERQSEILQSLSTGAAVDAVVKKSNENHSYYAQSRSPMTKIANIPSLIQCKQEAVECLEPTPITPFLQADNSAYYNSAFSIDSRKRHAEPECDGLSQYNQQALPSIGAMLGSFAKKPRQNNQQQSSLKRKTHMEEQKSISLPASPARSNLFSAAESTRISCAVNSPLKTVNSFCPASVLSAAVSKQEEVVPGAISLESCDYNLNSTSPPSLMPNADGLLDLDDIINCYDNKHCDNHIANIEWEDVMLSNNIVDSPTGRSDSGISMDDSLDWITDNPVFDL